MNGPNMHKDEREMMPVVIVLLVLFSCLLAAAIMPFVWTALR